MPHLITALLLAGVAAAAEPGADGPESEQVAEPTPAEQEQIEALLGANLEALDALMGEELDLEALTAQPPPAPKTTTPTATPTAPVAKPSMGRLDSYSPPPALSSRALSHDQQRQIKHCYSRALADDPALAGAVELAVVIGADGRVSKAWLERDEPGSAALSECLIKRASRWRYAEPEGGSDTATFALRFDAS